MRSALTCLNACRYVPKHAAPREPLAPQTRSALAVGLAAAMLPIGAGTAFADDPRPALPSSSTTAAVLEPVAVTADAPTPEAPEVASPEESPDRGSQEGASQDGASQGGPSHGGASAVRSASVRALVPARVRSETSLSFSVRQASRARVPVGVRLRANGRAVKDGYVRLERSTSQGWTYAGRLLTDADGIGRGTLRVAGPARLRAAYTGTQVRTPAVSAARTVRAVRQAGAVRAARTVSTLRAASGQGDAVLAEAARHVGKPYVYGAVGPEGFDCSGYTRYVYARATGRTLPHNSRAQERVATPVSKADAQPGDLVFMQDVSGHVGIYAGDGRMYDAPRSGRSVSLRAIWSSNYTVGRVS